VQPGKQQSSKVDQNNRLSSVFDQQITNADNSLENAGSPLPQGMAWQSPASCEVAAASTRVEGELQLSVTAPIRATTAGHENLEQS